MGQVSSKFRRAEGGLLIFWCPGCETSHAVKVEGDGAWGYNGNAEAPTFTPSVLLRSGHYCSTHKPGDACWCTFNQKRAAEGKEPAAFRCEVCHSFVTDGKIHFLDDCTHPLKGQTVPLPELPEHCRD